MKSTLRTFGGRCPRYFFFVCCGLPLVSPGHAAEPPIFVVHTIGDEQPAGPLTSFAANGAIQVGALPALAGSEIIGVSLQGTPPPHFPYDRPYVLLTNGDRFPAQLLNIVSEKARLLADL